jgi:hypothetical protein
MKGITTWIVLGSLLLSGCDQKSVHMEASSDTDPLSDISSSPAFTCQHETLPRHPRIPMSCLNTPAGCKK